MTQTKDNTVLSIEQLLTDANIWFNISNNLKAVSCHDAAKKRNRLGHTGIRLSDELKTYFGVYHEGTEKKYALLHCRGTQELDMQKVNQLLSSEVNRIDGDELRALSLAKGLVNPFMDLNNPSGEPMLQVFDHGVFEDLMPPYTMMTNAGHFNWGVEFYPKDLLNILPNTQVADIIGEEFKHPFIRHTIGILTGNGPESGMMLWKHINQAITQHPKVKDKGIFTGDLSFPQVIVESLPELGISMELSLRHEQTKTLVLESVEKLCQNGATLICLACNTSQHFIKEIDAICAKHHAQFVSMPTLVDQYLSEHNIIECDFLGIKSVTDFDNLSAFSALNKKYTVHVPSTEDLNRISQLAFAVKQTSVNTSSLNKLRNLINQSTKTNIIIVALSEISILLDAEINPSKRKRQYIDTLNLVAQQTADIYIDGIFDTLHKRSRPKKRY